MSHVEHVPLLCFTREQRRCHATSGSTFCAYLLDSFRREGGESTDNGDRTQALVGQYIGVSSCFVLLGLYKCVKLSTKTLDGCAFEGHTCSVWDGTIILFLTILTRYTANVSVSESMLPVNRSMQTSICYHNYVVAKKKLAQKKLKNKENSRSLLAYATNSKIDHCKLESSFAAIGHAFTACSQPISAHWCLQLSWFKRSVQYEHFCRSSPWYLITVEEEFISIYFYHTTNNFRNEVLVSFANAKQCNLKFGSQAFEWPF